MGSLKDTTAFNKILTINAKATAACAVLTPVVGYAAPAYAGAALITYSAAHGAYHAHVIFNKPGSDSASAAQALTEGVAVGVIDFTLGKITLGLASPKNIAYIASIVSNAYYSAMEYPFVIQLGELLSQYRAIYKLKPYLSELYNIASGIQTYINYMFQSEDTFSNPDQDIHDTTPIDVTYYNCSFVGEHLQ